MTALKLRTLIWITLLAVVFGCSSAGTQTVSSEQAPAKKMTSEEAAARLHEMIDSGDVYTTEAILPLYDQLDGVDLEFMIGTWKGGKFDGGKPDPINWYGKRFNSANDVEPLLARKPDGSVYSFSKWGMAMMREIKYRDKVSASLIYDSKPIMDYFRKIDDNTLLGLGEMKGKTTFFFYLKRDKELASN